MTLPFKHIGLLIGLVSVIISFLFFARHQDVYQILLIGGLAISLIFFLLVLFRKGNVKSKILWTIVVIFFVAFQRLTEPILIDTSYRIYIRQNKDALADINNILLHKSGDITILNDNINDKNNQVKPAEYETLIKGRKKLGVYFISKSDKGIYYGLWGFLDVRLGITYWTNDINPDNNYRHLTGNWYH
ncbi:MAG: hypothetical protein M3004_14820 [Bacteroidota bacterium]|nr:hypothetical protein [Bacteroidota bacterium]